MSNPFVARQVKGRRGGPAKPPLSQATIVEAAFELLMKEGLDGMSLRKVAAALETGAASLYVYVGSLDELQALVCDRGLSGVRTTGRSGLDWRSRLLAVLDSYMRVLHGTPGLAELAMRTIAIGPNALRILEKLLELLEEGGIDGATAAWATDLLTLYVTAIAAEQSVRGKQVNPLGPVAEVIGTISARNYPRIYAAQGELLSGGPSRSTWALDVLLAGILATPRGAARSRRKREPTPRSKARARKPSKE